MAEYTGNAHGWIPERFLRQRRFIPVLTVNTEVSNKIAVDIEMRTFEGTSNPYVVGEAVALECALYRSTGIEALVTHFHIGEVGDGTELSTTDNARLFVRTSASGTAQLEITDVAGGSGQTLHLVVTPLNVPGYPGYVTVTFN